jgi:hypothetical protein
MSADWYYLHHGFFGGQKTVGPITEVDFQESIQRGRITPETLVSSTSKTHGKWVKMHNIPVALKLYQKNHPSYRKPTST